MPVSDHILKTECEFVYGEWEKEGSPKREGQGMNKNKKEVKDFQNAN